MQLWINLKKGGTTNLDLEKPLNLIERRDISGRNEE